MPIIGEFEEVIKRESASFNQLVETTFHQNKKFNPDEESRIAHLKYHPKVLSYFEANHGGITQFFEAKNIVAASVITDKRYFDFMCPYNLLTGAEDLLIRLESIYDEAKTYLPKNKISEITKSCYATSTHLLQLVDDCSIPDSIPCKEDKQKRITFSVTMLDNIERRIEVITQRYALLYYVIGMLVGTISISCAILYSLKFLELSIFMCSIIGGSIGASISVLTRITNYKLYLDHKVGKPILFLIGFFRAFIGATMGLALCWIIEGGILPIAVESGSKNSFYLGLGFISGFSERWAQDMLSIGKNRLSDVVKNASDASSTNSENKNDQCSL